MVKLGFMAFRLATLADGRAVLLDDGLVDPAGLGEPEATARWWGLSRLTERHLVDPHGCYGCSCRS